MLIKSPPFWEKRDAADWVTDNYKPGDIVGYRVYPDGWRGLLDRPDPSPEQQRERDAAKMRYLRKIGDAHAAINLAQQKVREAVEIRREYRDIAQEWLWFDFFRTHDLLSTAEDCLPLYSTSTATIAESCSLPEEGAAACS